MAQEHAGKSIIGRLWEQMDIKFAELMELQEQERSHDAESIRTILEEGLDADTEEDSERVAEEITKYVKLQGQCTGLCYAISVMQHPYKPTSEAMDLVRAEARERWDADDEIDHETDDEEE